MVAAYVESQCPYSIAYIQEMVKPTLSVKGIEQILELQFTYYGNEQYTEDEGVYTFTCQHGPIECWGNLLNNCALNLI